MKLSHVRFRSSVTPLERESIAQSQCDEYGWTLTLETTPCPHVVVATKAGEIVACVPMENVRSWLPAPVVAVLPMPVGPAERAAMTFDVPTKPDRPRKQPATKV